MSILVELLFELVLGPLFELILTEGFSGLWRALRSSSGGWVLLGVCGVCAAWFWGGWRLGMSGAGGFPHFLAIVSVLGSPVFALICAFTWAGRFPAPVRSSTPSRRPRQIRKPG